MRKEKATTTASRTVSGELKNLYPYTIILEMSYGVSVLPEDDVCHENREHNVVQIVENVVHLLAVLDIA